MAKAPAFQFYAADFLTDTAEMTDKEVGVYIRLLSHQWINGSLHSDPNRLANGVAIGVLEVWNEISHKFPLCEDGRRRNPRLEETRKQQQEYRERQAEAGREGAKKRWAKSKENDGNPIGNPIGNPNGQNMALQSSTSTSSSITTSKDIGDKSPSPKNAFSDEDNRCAEFIFSKIRELNPTAKPPNMKKWAESVRLMRERDNRTHREIIELFTWANNDQFWKTNILSPQKLREKWDSLVIKKNNQPKTMDVGDHNRQAVEEAKRLRQLRTER